MRRGIYGSGSLRCLASSHVPMANRWRNRAIVFFRCHSAVAVCRGGFRLLGLFGPRTAGRGPRIAVRGGGSGAGGSGGGSQQAAQEQKERGEACPPRPMTNLSSGPPGRGRERGVLQQAGNSG